MRDQLISVLDQYEDSLIDAFAKQPFFEQLPRMEWSVVHEVLLQRRFLSHCFTSIYDLVVDGLEQEEHKKIVRRLIRDEYPDKQGNTPSHRELLIHDLMLLGLDKATIMKAQPTPMTSQTMERSFQLVYRIQQEANVTLRNLGLLLIVRFWGEILVATEYNCLWIKLSERMSPSKSRFYYDHYTHDQKNLGLGQPPAFQQVSHADSTSRFILELVTGADSVAFFKKTEQEIQTIKTDFYTQFLGK